MELTEEQKLVTGIADYFNIEVPDIISEYVTDFVTVQRMIYAIVTVRNTDRLKRLYNANKNTFYDAVQNYNSEAYMENDKLASQIKEANDLAVKVTQANIEILQIRTSLRSESIFWISCPTSGKISADNTISFCFCPRH